MEIWIAKILVKAARNTRAVLVRTADEASCHLQSQSTTAAVSRSEGEAKHAYLE